MAIHNYPKQIVPPFGKDDIKDIVQDAITNEEIVLPTGETGLKLYKHSITAASSFPMPYLYIDTTDNSYSTESAYVITDNPDPAEIKENYGRKMLVLKGKFFGFTQYKSGVFFNKSDGENPLQYGTPNGLFQVNADVENTFVDTVTEM